MNFKDRWKITEILMIWEQDQQLRQLREETAAQPDAKQDLVQFDFNVKF